jgi:hypothetical protein
MNAELFYLLVFVCSLTVGGLLSKLAQPTPYVTGLLEDRRMGMGSCSIVVKLRRARWLNVLLAVLFVVMVPYAFK